MFTLVHGRRAGRHPLVERIQTAAIGIRYGLYSFWRLCQFTRPAMQKLFNNSLFCDRNLNFVAGELWDAYLSPRDGRELPLEKG